MIRVKKNALPSSTVFLNRSDSVCANCGKGANPTKRFHDEVISWAKDNPEGCGIEWTHISSNYTGESIEEVAKEMRPDLIFIRQYEVTRDESDDFSVEYDDGDD